MVIKKTYTGNATRTLLPIKSDDIGVEGDVDASIIAFSIPNSYTGWKRQIEWDVYLTDDSGNRFKPVYGLSEYDTFTIPGELTKACGGQNIKYNLILISPDLSVTEKSAQASVYFWKSSEGTVTPPDYKDYWAVLTTEAYIDSQFGIDTTEHLPYISFTAPNDSVHQLLLDVPYIDVTTGKIDPRFLDPGMIVSLFNITSPDLLTTLTDADVTDWAYVYTGTNEGELYLCINSDPTKVSSWLLVRTLTPTYNSVTVPALSSTVIIADNTGKLSPSVTKVGELAQLSGVTSNVQNQIDSEINTRASEVADLSTRINTEATTRQTEDNKLTQAILTESQIRESADTELKNELDAEVASRTSADASLSNRIDTEASTREAADNAISAELNKLVSGYKFIQSSAATTWDITHNLGHIPNVQVYDTGGNLIITAVNQVSENETIISVIPSMAGYAILR